MPVKKYYITRQKLIKILKQNNYNCAKTSIYFGCSGSNIKKLVCDYNIIWDKKKTKSENHSERIKGNQFSKGKYHKSFCKLSKIAKHNRIASIYGKANCCENLNCEKEKQVRFEWANINHQYNEDMNEWIRLCSKCHRKFDMQSVKLNITKNRILKELK